GVFGIGFAVAAVNAAVAIGWTERRPGMLAPAALLVAAMLGYGAVAERAVGTGRPEGAVPIAAAQANLDLGTQWKSEIFRATLGAAAALTRQATARRPARLVVWPESALTFFVESEPSYRACLGRVLSRADAELLTGGPRAIADHGAGEPRYLNAAFVLSPAG